MRLSRLLADIKPQYAKLSKSEAEILNTLVTIKNGNAYGLWKASGLKHYPTALRTVKKLKEKRLIKALDESGTRGERIYVPTLFGTLLNYVLRDEENRIVEMVSLKSRHFQELQKSKLIEETHSWIASIIRHAVYDVGRGEFHTIDDILKYVISSMIVDNISNLEDSESKDVVIKFSKIKWVRDFAIEEIERHIRWWKKHIKEMKKLKETLMIK